MSENREPNLRSGPIRAVLIHSLYRLPLKLKSLFVSPCPPECNFQSETKIEPDLRLREPVLTLGLYSPVSVGHSVQLTAGYTGLTVSPLYMSLILSENVC